MDPVALTDPQLDAAMSRALTELRMADFHALGDEADRRLAAAHERLSRPSALAAAARWYAGAGVAVFPCRPRGKAPLLRAAHPAGNPLRMDCRGACGAPGHGLYDATTDVDQVARWWSEHPQANIGVPTGGRFDVIDVDGPRGYVSLGHLGEEGALPADLGWVVTPRGGMHLYCTPTGDGNATGVRPGIDYRGLGGFVVAPPSIGANGRRYEWLEPLDLSGLAV